MAINVSQLLAGLPKTNIQTQPSKLDSLLYMIARMNEGSSRSNQPTISSSFGSGLGAGFARGIDLGVQQKFAKETQQSSQEFQKAENKLSRDQAAQFHTDDQAFRNKQAFQEERYRNKRLALDQQLADDNYYFKLGDYLENQRKTDAQIKLTEEQTKGAEIDRKIKEAVDPKERNRLESERFNVLLKTAETEGKTAELKLAEAQKALKNFDPADVKAVQEGRWADVLPETARQIQALESARANAEAVGEKSDAVKFRNAVNIMSQGEIDPNQDPRAYINAHTTVKKRGATTVEDDTKAGLARKKVGYQLRDKLNNLKVNFDSGESLLGVNEILSDLAYTDLSPEEQSKIENKLFEEKLIPAVSGKFNNKTTFLNNLIEMNRLKIDRGNKPLIPVVGTVGNSDIEQVKSYRPGTEQELQDFINRWKGM